MLTDTPYSKTPGTSIHLHISKESACHSQVLPLPWPPRPIFIPHFLHPPGGSLHYSVPESAPLVRTEMSRTQECPLIFCGIIDSLGRLQRRAAAGVSSVYDFLLKISRHLDHASSLCKSDADFAWHSRCRSDAWNLWMQSDIGHSTCLTVSGCNRTLHLIHHYDHRVWWPPQTGRSCLLRGLCHADAGRQCKPEGVGRVTAQQLTGRSAATVRLESVSASSPNLSMTRRASMSRHACRLRRRPPPGLRRVKA